MPRYYRRRYTRTLVKPKKKWASNIISMNDEAFSGYGFSKVLVLNKVQANAPTPTVIKTGNFKVSLDIGIATVSETRHVVLTAYIIYVPEGWPSTQPSDFGNLVNTHPEWIMATKVIGGSWSSTGSNNTDTLNMSTRLKRNLNSGDGVVFFLTSNVSVTTGGITGNVRYWTCAN